LGNEMKLLPFMSLEINLPGQESVR
jgi:hypothetical protein